MFWSLKKKRAPNDAPTWSVNALHVQPELMAMEFKHMGEAVAEVRKQNRDLLHREQLLTQQTMLLIL